jgi:hypothetical protein
MVCAACADIVRANQDSLDTGLIHDVPDEPGKGQAFTLETLLFVVPQLTHDDVRARFAAETMKIGHVQERCASGRAARYGHSTLIETHRYATGAASAIARPPSVRPHEDQLQVERRQGERRLVATDGSIGRADPKNHNPIGFSRSEFSQINPM